MEARRDERTQWVKPVLVEKDLSETRAGRGVTGDGTFEMQS